MSRKRNLRTDIHKNTKEKAMQVNTYTYWKKNAHMINRFPRNLCSERYRKDYAFRDNLDKVVGDSREHISVC